MLLRSPVGPCPYKHSDLDPAEEELMVPELTITQKSLRPGHSRLTWNSMGIKEYIDEGNQQISALTSKIRQVEILRVQLQDCIDYVAQTKLLKYVSTKVKFYSYIRFLYL